MIFGLNYLGVLKLNLFRGSGRGMQAGNLNFFSAFLFGLVFSIGWTPCVGAFLGSALMLASQQGSAVQGTLMLLCYSAGLGVPFLISAVLIDQLKGAFNWIKGHYTLVNRICGGLLITVGIAMATGLLGRLLAVLS
jgi:cytochrome c-type biogenesis protein